MILIGIDPGQSGGIAIIQNNVVSICKMPDTEHDISAIFRTLAHSSGIKALIEKVHAMPGQGVTSMFTFGRNYGFLRGCLSSLGIPFDEINPHKWQQTLGCLTKGDKNVSKAKAQQLFPWLKITHAVADAVLICEYLRRKEGLPSPLPPGGTNNPDNAVHGVGGNVLSPLESSTLREY